MLLVQIQWFGTGTKFSFDVLHQCGKRVKTKSQKVLEANLYVCRSYRGKTGKWAFLPTLHPPRSILNRVKRNTKLQKKSQH